jgi:hypothetical protein
MFNVSRIAGALTICAARQNLGDNRPLRSFEAIVMEEPACGTWFVAWKVCIVYIPPGVFDRFSVNK